MRVRHAALPALCGLAWFFVAATQAPSQEDKPARRAPDSVRLAEEMEVLRVIVTRTLHELAPPQSTVGAYGQMGSATGDGMAASTYFDLQNPVSGGGGLGPGGMSTGGAGGAGMAGMPGMGAGFDYNVSASPSTPPLAEAEVIYVPGHGAVCTMTVTRPLASNAVSLPQRMRPKPEATDLWQQVRNELLGAPQTSDNSNVQSTKVSLWELVLRILAENGRYLTQLPADERVTVALTFRVPHNYVIRMGGDMGMAGGAMDPFGQGGGSAPADGAGQAGAGASPFDPFSAGPGGATAAFDDVYGPGEQRDYVMLGDLHMKQGKPQDAVKAYRNALKIKPRAKHLHVKLAQAFLALGDVAAAKKSLESAPQPKDGEAADGGEKPADVSQPTEIPLARKLVVSVTKRLLDRLAADEISFEELRDAATLDQLNAQPTSGNGDGELNPAAAR